MNKLVSCKGFIVTQAWWASGSGRVFACRTNLRMLISVRWDALSWFILLLLLFDLFKSFLLSLALVVSLSLKYFALLHIHMQILLLRIYLFQKFLKTSHISLSFSSILQKEQIIVINKIKKHVHKRTEILDVSLGFTSFIYGCVCACGRARSRVWEKYVMCFYNVKDRLLPVILFI